MADEVLRYRAELDTSQLSAQLATIQAEVGTRLAGMSIPIQQNIATTFAAGASGLMSAGGMAARNANFSMGGLGYGPAATAMGGGPGQNIGQMLGYNPGFLQTGMGMAGGGGAQSYLYTPTELRYASGQEFTQRIADASAYAVRGGLQAGGEYLGGLQGFNAGAAIGGGMGRLAGKLAGDLTGIPGLGTAGAILGGLWGGSKGADIGMEMGGSLYGPVGGAQMGAAASNLAWMAATGGRSASAMPGLLGTLGYTIPEFAGGAIGAVGGAALQLGLEHYGRVNEARDVVSDIGMRSLRAADTSSANLMGRGFTRGQETLRASELVKQASRDFRYDFQDVMDIAQGGNQVDYFAGARTVEQFKERMRSLLDSAKKIQTTLSQTVAESTQTLQEMVGGLGVSRPDEIGMVAGATRVRSLNAAVAPAEMFQAGMGGAGSVRGTYLAPMSGFGAGQLGLETARSMLITDAIRGAKGEGMTRTLFAAVGGTQEAGGLVSRAVSTYGASEEFETLLQAAYDPKTRTFDKRFLESQARHFDHGEIVERASKVLSGDDWMQNAMNFRADRASGAAAAGPDLMAAAALSHIRERAEVLDPTRPMNRNRLLGVGTQYFEEMGFDPNQSRVVMEGLLHQEQLGRARRRAEAVGDWTPDMDDKMRQVGFTGALRRASVFARGMGEDIGAAVAEPFMRGADWASSTYNRRIAGITPPPTFDMSTSEQLEMASVPLSPPTRSDLSGSPRSWSLFRNPIQTQEERAAAALSPTGEVPPSSIEAATNASYAAPAVAASQTFIASGMALHTGAKAAHAAYNMVGPLGRFGRAGAVLGAGRAGAAGGFAAGVARVGPNVLGSALVVAGGEFAASAGEAETAGEAMARSVGGGATAIVGGAAIGTGFAPGIGTAVGAAAGGLYALGQMALTGPDHYSTLLGESGYMTDTDYERLAHITGSVKGGEDVLLRVGGKNAIMTSRTEMRKAAAVEGAVTGVLRGSVDWKPATKEEKAAEAEVQALMVSAGSTTEGRANRQAAIELARTGNFRSSAGGEATLEYYQTLTGRTGTEAGREAAAKELRDNPAKAAALAVYMNKEMSPETRNKILGASGGDYSQNNLDAVKKQLADHEADISNVVGADYNDNKNAIQDLERTIAELPPDELASMHISTLLEKAGLTKGGHATGGKDLATLERVGGALQSHYTTEPWRILPEGYGGAAGIDAKRTSLAKAVEARRIGGTLEGRKQLMNEFQAVSTADTQETFTELQKRLSHTADPLAAMQLLGALDEEDEGKRTEKLKALHIPDAEKVSAQKEKVFGALGGDFTTAVRAAHALGPVAAGADKKALMKKLEDAHWGDEASREKHIDSILEVAKTKGTVSQEAIMDVMTKQTLGTSSSVPSEADVQTALQKLPDAITQIGQGFSKLSSVLEKYLS